MTEPRDYERLDLKWASASEFIRDVVEACGLRQPDSEGVVDLPALVLQVVGQIEVGKLAEDRAYAAEQREQALREENENLKDELRVGLERASE